MVDPDSKRLHVSVSDGTGRAVRDGGLARWLAATAPPAAAGELGVALVSDARMRALNRRYRSRDIPTDVLSFGSEARGLGPASTEKSRQSRSEASLIPCLGDIVIATGVARRQAKEAGHSYQTELRVLALHGLLHLLGYDHHDRYDNGRMARVEARLRRRGGLASGLIARASARPRARRASA